MSFRTALRTLHSPSAPVAQLDRAPGFEPGGRRFESVRAHLITKYFGSPGQPAGNKQFEPPTDKQDRFDNPALRRVGRCRARRGGGPERSGGRAAQPRAIRPGALFNLELRRDRPRITSTHLANT